MDDKILEELKKINLKLEKNKKIKILKVGDVAEILKINKNQATKLFKRTDFPALTNCGDNKIEETALYNWLQSRHSDDASEDEEIY